jgi:long-chain acyl-CoA synthetase
LGLDISQANVVSPRDTLIDYFADLVTIRGEFLVYDDGYRRRSHTYEAVGRAARGFAATLARHGVRKGDKVVIWGENRPEWIVAYWGCIISGVIVVPIDYRSSPAFVERVRQLVGARFVLVGEEVPAPAAPVSAAAIPAAAVPSQATPAFAADASSGAGSDTGTGPPHVWPLADLDWQADGPMPAAGATRDDVVQIIFTSGATADPKGVVIRHRNVLANIVPVERGVIKYRHYARPFHPLRFVNLLPLSHMFGQSMATNVPPMVRGTVIFTKSLNPHDLLRLVKSRRVSVLVCVPKILDVLRDHITRVAPESLEAPPPGTSLPARWWRYRRVHSAFGLKFWAFVVGAAPLPPDLEEFWRRMGFAVIQGYGLTETAPIVTLNHPFKTSKGSVGTPIAGVEITLADDGEILVRGENVTSGYYGGGGTTESVVDDGGWLHTGDIGERDAEGRLFIKGRKKEMIVTPEGLNVYPEDVERALNALPGVKDSAVVGVVEDAQERVHAVLQLAGGAQLGDSAQLEGRGRLEGGAGLGAQAQVDAIVKTANAALQDHQRIRTASVWPFGDLPRTDGTKKLKRSAIRDWVSSGARPVSVTTADSIEALVERFTRGREVGGATTIEELGLSSLERVELMVALEDRFQTRLDEGQFSRASSVADLKALVTATETSATRDEPVDFPTWNRSWPVRLVRRLSLATWILPLARLYARADVLGLDHLRGLDGPVLFASNHQSHMDGPVILAALPGRWRARLAPAMSKEFFKAHFFPATATWREWFTSSLNYYLAAFFFNAFPLPQRETGARQTLSYMGEITGDGWSVLIFPEGVRSATGDIKTFRGGIGMIGAKLDLPVIPIRLDGVDRILPTGSSVGRPGRVRVAFGAPLRLHGDDYVALAQRVEDAVRAL